LAYAKRPLGAVHKRRPQLGEGGDLSSAGILRTRGFFRCGRPRFLVQKNPDFWNLWCVSTDRGRGASADIFQARGRGQIFAILCGQPLTNFL